MHRKVCEAVKKVSMKYFRSVGFYPINGEPACADYIPLNENIQVQENLSDDTRDNQMARRRADIGFTSGTKTILIDCTTASPLAKEIKNYRPGSAADAASKRKVKDYQRFFQINKTNQCNILFFAIETSGGLGKEARDYVKLLAKLSGGSMGSEIQRIYQTLAVEFQNARANQVYITRKRYVSDSLPPRNQEA